MRAQLLYTFNIVFSIIAGIVSMNRGNTYTALSCVFTFLFSLLCLMSSFKRKRTKKTTKKQLANSLEYENIDFSKGSTSSQKQEISTLAKVLNNNHPFKIDMKNQFLVWL